MSGSGSSSGAIDIRLTLGQVILGAILGSVFFIEKIWILGGSRLLSLSLTLLAFAGWGGGLSIGIVTFLQYAQDLPLVTDLIIYQKTITTFLELLIVAFMVHLLWKHRSGVPCSDSMLNRLVLFMLSRGIAIG
ncbi:hypothetical protein K488DRAFT_89814 [Vararia minispora EC-137]|uniref:Uncharacterized protein n=1 Tax=Vararia minispora EC-137 TaxID=1314806 RepID=A0ACB8Q9J1_9AGAM|nr:hypothetical protein K488DRAFT_89814 [Vararia minispora EC-137]